MPWTPKGGDQSPWGSGNGNNSNPWGQPSGGGGRPSPDMGEMLRKGWEQFRRRRSLPPINGLQGLKYLGLAVAALWLGTGIYQVQTDEQGVVLRFGKWTNTTDPGLHYHLPYPIEAVLLPKVTRVSQIQLGYRSGDRFDRNGHREVPEESRMLTGDENIVEANFAVFWRIKDAGKYLFSVRDPETTVKITVESVMRNVVARNPIQAVLSDKRDQIAQEATVELQQVLDLYDAGIFIQEVQLQKVDPPAAVIDAFNDVQRARADQERLRNEAEAYHNDIVPRARGDALRMVQDAEAYKEQVVDLAQGEAKRFTSVLGAYRLAQDVTARRMYVESMEEVLRNATKIVIDPAATRNGQGLMPYLPLEAAKRPAPPATPTGAAK